MPRTAACVDVLGTKGGGINEFDVEVEDEDGVIDELGAEGAT